MTAATLDTYPAITVTKAGVPVRLPLQLVPQRGGAGGADLRPVAVARNPKIAFPPPLALGEGSVRRNYDIDEVIFTTWQGGMGEDRYPAATNPTSFQTGQLETRFPGVLACRALATQLGAAGVYGASRGVRIVETSYTNATPLLYLAASPPTTAYRYNAAGTAWTAIQSTGVNLAVYQHAFGSRGIFVTGTRGGVYGVFRSTDGIAWDSMAIGAMTTCLCVANFDNRIFVLDSVSGGGGTYWTNTAYASTDVAAAAAGAGTWTAGNNFVTPISERPVKLFTWMYPPDKGRTTLWCLTSARLWYYDYYAATPSWVEWFRFRDPLQITSQIAGNDAVVSRQNNNLYVCISDLRATWEFTGATITRYAPGKKGGLPAASTYKVEVLADDGQQVLGFGAADNLTASVGAALAMLEGGSWHHLFDRAGTYVIGGGAGESKIWVHLVNQSTGLGEVWELDRWDLQVLPQYASGRTYEANVQYLTTGWITGGLTNVNKRALYVEIDAIKADGTAGLEAGANITVQYIGRRTGATVATTLTSASTFPNVVDFSGAYSDKEFQIVVGLKRGTATSASPFLRALKVGYRPRPKQRFTYSVRVDLRDECPAFRENGKFHGYTANYLRQWLDELADSDDAGLDDPLVGLSYGGYGNLVHPRYRSIPQCEVLIQGQESSDKADGLYLLTFSDISAPTSG